jgi:hypothetical protein
MRITKPPNEIVITAQGKTYTIALPDRLTRHDRERAIRRFGVFLDGLTDKPGSMIITMTLSPSTLGRLAKEHRIDPNDPRIIKKLNKILSSESK